MSTKKKTAPKFVICLDKGDEDLLTPRKIYEVLSDEDSERSGYLRIIDDEGEDYLYPAKYFIFVVFTPEVSCAIQESA
ncbi:MAG: hypothetical protein IPM66_11330 [Acidobacteriota bacterium]|nr:MAG: hypothetical protein IPM66_11330 [Acidobacteriota bacterium]